MIGYTIVVAHGQPGFPCDDGFTEFLGQVKGVTETRDTPLSLEILFKGTKEQGLLACAKIKKYITEKAEGRVQFVFLTIANDKDAKVFEGRNVTKKNKLLIATYEHDSTVLELNNAMKCQEYYANSAKHYKKLIVDNKKKLVAAKATKKRLQKKK